MAGKPAWAIGARQGPLRRHKRMVFFACEGLIAMYDERNPEEEVYLVVTPGEFEERAHGLGTWANEMGKGDEKWMKQEARMGKQAANDMLETVKEARYMGDPSDPAVRAFWARHRRNSSIQISLSAGSNPEGYPELPDVDRGPNTGRTADPGEPLGTVLDDPNRVHKPPRRKPRGGVLIMDDLL